MRPEESTLLADLLLTAAVRCRVQAKTRGPDRLTEHEMCLLLLVRDAGTVGIKALRERLGLRPAAISRVLTNLASRKRPLIATCRDPADDRRVQVTLTTAGKAALTLCHAQRTAALADRLHELTPAELADLLSLRDALSVLETGAERGVG
jgi:DNA-binding MarR family transcriptional regulator